MINKTVKRLDLFERYLSFWVLLCMGFCMLDGKLLPRPVAFLSNWEFVDNSHINVPIAVLIWLMIYPMMLKIDFGGLKGVAERPKGLLVTLLVNWLVKPSSMAFLGWFFVQFVFSQRLGWIDAGISNRGQQLLRTGGRGRNRTFRPHQSGCSSHGRRRFSRSACDALCLSYLREFARLVRRQFTRRFVGVGQWISR
jgi:hypothetical protein